MHVQIVLFDGFDPLDAIAPYEVLYAGAMAFAVTVDGETLTGTSRAGRLPASKVTGRRRTAP